jgi:hypothetical protein
VNLALRLFGLHSKARTRTSWLFAAGMLVFVGVMVFTAVHAWHFVDVTMFRRLNGCMDSRSKSFGVLQELPYQPSPEYVSCLNGVHHTAAIEASLVIGAMACVIVALAAWEIENFLNEYAVSADGSQARTYRFRALYVTCLVAGVVCVLAWRAVLDPYAS